MEGLSAMGLWATGATGPAANPIIQFAPYVLIFGIFYFLLIMPARRKQKRHEEMLADLKKGDKVVTQGGIHGTVAAVSDTVVQLKIADNVKIEVARHAVAGQLEN